MTYLNEDKKERIRLLIEEGVSRRQICKMEHVGSLAITENFGKSDRYKRRFDAERRAQVEELVQRGMRRSQICKELHVSGCTLTRHLGLVRWNKKKRN